MGRLKHHCPDLTTEEVERFWSKIDVRTPAECWNWVDSGRHNFGYGFFKAHGRTHNAHRLMWRLVFGEIPDDGSYHGMCVCHSCDNPRCVNPWHLFLGTAHDNNSDRHAKGRTVVVTPTIIHKGEDHYKAKITSTDAKRIKQMRGRPYQEIADYFGISKGAVNHILNGRSWKHV